MERQLNAAPTTFELLKHLKPLSFLPSVALHELAASLDLANFRRGEVILDEKTLSAGVHIQLKGVAKITRLNPAGERSTIALVPPGPIPQFVSLPLSRWDFRCEAFTDCRVGSVSWVQFDSITRAAPKSDLRKFHENNLTQWYRFFAASLDLRERLIFTLLQLGTNFGVTESRGTLLRIPVSHDDLAGLVGATRPRVTERLAEMEREHLLTRQGRRLIVNLDKLRSSIGNPPSRTSEAYGAAGAHPHFHSERQLYSAGSFAALSA